MSSGCTLTLAGQCCNSLTSVYDFIVKLKDLDLKGENLQKCCNDGTTVKKGTTSNGVAVTQDCKCPEEIAAAKRQYTCLFDNCMSWTDLRTWLTNLKTAWLNWDFAPAGIAIWTAIFGFFGAVGPNDVLKDALPIFYTTTGGLVGIVAGILGGIYASINTINVAVKTSFASQAAGVGTNFLSYGGNSWAGDALGLLEASWVVGYIGLAAWIVASPFLIAWEMDKAFRQVAKANQNNKSFDYLFTGLVSAVGAWGASVALKQSTDKLIGFYDIQRTDVSSYFKAQTTKDASWSNWVPVFVDIFHHELTVSFYWLLAATISGGSYTYAYYYIVQPSKGQ